MLKPAAAHKDVRVYSKGLGSIKLVSDQEMVAFIVRNLINNAIKFSRQSGKVEVSAEVFENGIKFSVQDHGVGKDSDTVYGLKEGEVPHSETGTWGERGTGLGLNLCRQFIKALQGSMEFRSSTQKGTVVTVRLPQLPLP